MTETENEGVDLQLDLDALGINFNNSQHRKQIECMWNFSIQPYPTNGIFCNSTWDSVSCWPTTPAGTQAIISCFAELNYIKYDTSKNATKECYPNGTWNNYSNYEDCQVLTEEILEDKWNVTEDTTIIYYVGYGISLIALIIALFIFTYFKDLRCLRNIFHCNLMVTYVLSDLVWIIMATLQTTLGHNSSSACITTIFLCYFQETNFFWMFVEGLYLYMLVVKTFHSENIKMPVYLFIGWGAPAIIIIIWAGVKSQLTHDSLAAVADDGIVLSVFCTWMQEHHYDFIFICPVLIILFVNVMFLLRIMWVLITKLRAATTAESQQYRKAAKALLVLIPLLGVTYILVISPPDGGLERAVFSYISAILLSTQGFTVSVLYCFLNGEVRSTIRHHWERWREERTIGNRTTTHSFRRDGSPKSRSESVRLYSVVSTDSRGGGHGRGRENSVSYATSNSYVGNGYSTNSALLGGGTVSRNADCHSRALDILDREDIV